MPVDKIEKLWLIITALIIIIIITSSTILWIHRDKGHLLTIEQPQVQTYTGEITIDGAVINPGTYVLNSGVRIDQIIQASGGIKENADLNHIHLIIPSTDRVIQPQKVDINCAEAWLLQALPGIGEARAKAIIDYRLQNGPYNSPEDLLMVPGISHSTLEILRDYITISY